MGQIFPLQINAKNIVKPGCDRSNSSQDLGSTYIQLQFCGFAVFLGLLKFYLHGIEGLSKFHSQIEPNSPHHSMIRQILDN